VRKGRDGVTTNEGTINGGPGGRRQNRAERREEGGKREADEMVNEVKRFGK